MGVMSRYEVLPPSPAPFAKVSGRFPRERTGFLIQIIPSGSGTIRSLSQCHPGIQPVPRGEQPMVLPDFSHQYSGPGAKRPGRSLTALWHVVRTRFVSFGFPLLLNAERLGRFGAEAAETGDILAGMWDDGPSGDPPAS